MSKETPSMRAQRAAAGDELDLEVADGEDGFGHRELRVERVAQPVAEQVHGEDEGGQRQAGEGDDPPFAGEQEVVADADQRAERGLASAAGRRRGTTASPR